MSIIDDNKSYSKYLINIKNSDSWSSTTGIMARGTAFKKNLKLDANALCNYILNAQNLDHLINKCKVLNGFYSFIFKLDNKLFIAVDQCRSIPLFYALNKDMLLISDDAFWIKNKIGKTHTHHIAEEEFLLLGYVTGPDTICKEIKQVQPGEIVCFDFTSKAVDVNKSRYARYAHNYDHTLNRDSITLKFDHILNKITQRMIEYANGRQILLPLSGGLDSRLLALQLKLSKYDNVATFTYGNIHSEESIISNAIAKGLDFPWFFVPYSIESWKLWYNTSEFHDYKISAFQLSSCVHIQDFPAVWELKKYHQISENAVVMPGICADLQAGSMSTARRRNLYLSEGVDLEYVIKSIIDHHYILFDWSKHRNELYPKFKERVKKFIGDTSIFPDAASIFESQFCDGKVAKFLINSVRAYEYWGLDWWLPYWDRDFISFWESVPLSYRIDKTFYDGYVYNLQNQLLDYPKKKIGRNNSNWPRRLRKYARRSFLGKGDELFSAFFKRYFEYDRNEFAWFGIMNRKQFKEWYTGREIIESALVLEHTGRWKIFS